MKKAQWLMRVTVAILVVVMVVLLPTLQPVLSCVRWEAWPKSLIVLHIIGDTFIWLAYVLIPVSVIKIRKEADLAMNQIFVLFAAFIILCGQTHGLSTLTTFWPYYWAQGELKLVTAVVSMATWVVLEYKIRPALRKLPKYQEILSAQTALETANSKLEAAKIVAEAKSRELASANEALLTLQAQLKREGEDVRDERDQLLHEKIQLQELEILTLSRVILEVGERILLVPVIGMLDSVRVSRLMNAILEEVVLKKANAVILDIAGVEVVDTAVADHILKIEKGLKLLGSSCIITGVRPVVALTLARIGVGLPQARATVKDGIAMVLHTSHRGPLKQR